ncbi:MAG: MurR/RpiR family transcriptional regulator [Cohnella sp.]|nr:MurR/RpiR family transcriptional regulator [Cohnella sp.]
MSNLFEWDMRNLSPSQKNIADYIEKNVNRIPYLTEKDIAREVPTSIASVSRFWRAAGYANLKDFKNRVREFDEISPAFKMKNMFNKISSDDLLGQVMEQTSEYLRDTSYHLDREELYRAVDAMVEAERIYIFASGPAEGLGHLLRFRLNRFGVAIENITKRGSQVFETLVNVKKQDTIILFHFSRTLPETKAILDYASELNCKTIIVSDRLVSDFHHPSNIVLYSSRGQMWEFHSMVAPTAIVESLIIAVGLRMENKALSTLEQLQSLRRRYSAFIPK